MTDLYSGAWWRIKFSEERNSYQVQCRNDRYLICTKPFYLRDTVLYTIVDLKEKVRGRDNYGGLGYETLADCRSVLLGLECGDVDISHRHRIPLNIKWTSSPIKQVLAEDIDLPF